MEFVQAQYTIVAIVVITIVATAYWDGMMTIRTVDDLTEESVSEVWVVRVGTVVKPRAVAVVSHSQISTGRIQNGARSTEVRLRTSFSHNSEGNNQQSKDNKESEHFELVGWS